MKTEAVENNAASTRERPKRIGGYLRKLARLERENERLREANVAQLAKGAVYLYFDEEIMRSLQRLAADVGAADVSEYIAEMMTAFAQGPPPDSVWRVFNCDVCGNKFQSIHWATRCPRCKKSTAEVN